MVFLKLVLAVKQQPLQRKFLITMVAQLVLQVKIDDEIYLLVNMYNSITESEQLKTSQKLETILLKFDNKEYNHIIFSSDFNIFFSALP